MKTGPRRSQWQMLASSLFLALVCAPLYAQTIQDQIMIPRKTLFTGTVYSYDSWDQYWEGTLKRINGNIGTVTTQSVTWSGNYGITDRLNVIAMVPYAWTDTSQGVLHGQKGFQDLTLAAKFNFLEIPFTKGGRLRAIAVLSGGIPLTDYNPDFQPLSIGFASKQIATRLTLNFQANRGWFLNGSTAYTWRANVTLDRPYYFTENQLFLSNEVAMPNVFDYVVAAGYLKNGLMAQGSFWQQRTLGGGDIRRQDIPFVSNRMNFSKVGGLVMYPLPKLSGLAFRVTFGYTVDGRNVGQSTTISTGLMYTLHLEKSSRK
ncbi:MAG TPA: transporter [Terriglobales bacterium]|nr:transporter [Terriglobales bacterium]